MILVLQQGSAPVHLKFNTVQLLQCKIINFLSPELWSRNSPELHSTDYEIWGVIQQHEHELRVTRLNKLSQRLLKSGNAVIQHLNEKMQFLCCCISPGSEEALVRRSGESKAHFDYLLSH